MAKHTKEYYRRKGLEKKRQARARIIEMIDSAAGQAINCQVLTKAQINEIKAWQNKKHNFKALNRKNTLLKE